jgi:hypothetical protein
MKPDEKYCERSETHARIMSLDAETLHAAYPDVKNLRFNIELKAPPNTDSERIEAGRKQEVGRSGHKSDRCG